MSIFSHLYNIGSYAASPFSHCCRKKTAPLASTQSSIPLDALPNVAVITDKEGIILDINKIGADLLGYTKKELLGTPLLEGLSPRSDEKRSPDSRWTFSRESEPTQNTSKIADLVRKDGTTFPANVKTTKFTAQNGAEQFLTTIDDCTEHQKKLKNAKMYAVHLLHDTRGSLGVIQNNLELLKDQQLPPEAQDPINSIRIGSTDITSLVNDTLDLEKLMEQEKPRVSDCFLKKFLIDVLQPSKELAKVHKKKLELSLSTIPPTIYCSIAEKDLAVVLRNLLSNAFKFTPADCRAPILCEISISPELTQQGMNILLFKVTNQGEGFTEEQKARIFTPFQQASSAISKKYGGTGVGLSQSKEVIVKAGGTLDAVSIPNTQEPSEEATEAPSEQPVPKKITTFFGTLPFRITQPPAFLEVPDAKTPRTPITPRRILFVDDNSVQGRSGSQPLKRAGHTVAIAKNISDATKQIQEQQERGTPYELVVTDLDLQDPAGDGIDLAKKVDVPVILLTGTLDLATQEKASAAKIKKCLIKGSKPQDLQDAIGDCFPTE